jgi:C-terminal processing protease CtpA/Prc
VKDLCCSGVGLLLEKERNGDTVVKKIISGGAAEEDGRMQLGDLVTHVNDIAVTPLPLDQVSFLALASPHSLTASMQQTDAVDIQVLEIIKGTEGTKVKMDVLNHDGKSVIELVRKKVSHVVGIISSKDSLSLLLRQLPSCSADILLGFRPNLC